LTDLASWSLFVEAMDRPVLRALYTRDADTLGKFLVAANHQRLEETKLGVNRDYLGVLAAEGMLRPDLRPTDLDYTLPTIVFGFFAAEPEGVAERIELHTRDMTDLQFPDASFDLVVSSLAIHNLPGDAARLAAIDEAVRVVRPGGHIAIADLGFTRLYAARLRQRGMTNVKREDLGRRAWWGLPLIRTHAVTATKPAPAPKQRLGER
jgi:SAM-dependent methyltransferase